MSFLALSCCRILCEVEVNFSGLDLQRSLFLLARLTLIFYFLKRLSTVLCRVIGGNTLLLMSSKSSFYFSIATTFAELKQFVYWVEHTGTPAHLLLNKGLAVLFKLSNARYKLICQLRQCLIIPTRAVCGDLVNHWVVQVVVIQLSFVTLLVFPRIFSLRRLRWQ